MLNKTRLQSRRRGFRSESDARVRWPRHSQKRRDLRLASGAF